MSVTFLSGVVRNRKIVQVGSNYLSNSTANLSQLPSQTATINPINTNTNNASFTNQSISSNSNTSPKNTGYIPSLPYILNYNNEQNGNSPEYDPIINIWTFTKLISNIITKCTGVCRIFKLRVHKFTFQWDLVLHFAISLGSLLPFIFTGERKYATLPLLIWAFYNVLFIIDPMRANALIPGFSRFKQAFQISVEEFFSPKLLPIISVSFLLVALSLAVTGRKLGGPPLCYSSCSKCLSMWDSSVIVDTFKPLSDPEALIRVGCGYLNGKELLGFYTMAQTSFLQFTTVIVAMSICMAWKVHKEELELRREAVNWLEKEDRVAYEMREDMIKKFGVPGSGIRPEGNVTWVVFGVIVALSFTLLGWHNWSVLPPSRTATLLIVLNLLTILTSTLMLHVGFFGRILSLYKRNFQRVEYITAKLSSISDQEIDSWWNFRNHVLNDDLALDYDIGGLAVSATFLINLLMFITVVIQAYREGFKAILEPPGSYAAYGCLYITLCLLKIFTLATNTFEEQFRHINGLQRMSIDLLQKASNMSFATLDQSLMNQGDNSHLHMPIAPSTDSLAPLGLMVESDDFYDTKSVNPLGSSIIGTNIGPLSGGMFYNSNMPSPQRSLPPLSSNSATFYTMNKGYGAPQSNNSSIPSSTNIPLNLSFIDDVENNSPQSVLNSSLPYSPEIAPGVSSLNPPILSRTLSGGGTAPSPRPIARTTTSSMAIAMKQQQQAILQQQATAAALARQQGIALTNERSASAEATRQTVTDMISQIRRYDPYPCILGIPVMPALFNSAKFYIFVFFMLIGSRVFVSCIRIIT